MKYVNSFRTRNLDFFNVKANGTYCDNHSLFIWGKAHLQLICSSGTVEPTKRATLRRCDCCYPVIPGQRFCVSLVQTAR